MNLTQIRHILQQRNLRPLKQLGQNFLIDQNLAHIIVDALEHDGKSEVLEIGPGLGALTELLLHRRAPLKVIEIDRGLCLYLKETLGSHPCFQLIEGDALKIIPALDTLPAKIIGNLPYHISTALLAEIFTRAGTLPTRMIVMLQKEMAQRLVAQPRTKDYGAVSVLAQNLYQTQVIRHLGPQSFYPMPEVDSCVVQFDRLPQTKSIADRRAFYLFVKKGFSQRRKKLTSTLGVKIDARAEELSPTEWRQHYESMQ